MSSFSKNIIPRREHRERSQPRNRLAKHGLLEKKKDYKLRARDANRKAHRLKLLKEKAAFRNPDEFYHAMEHAVPTKGGRVRRNRDPNVADNHHTADGAVRKLVETQDRAYVQMKRTRERTKISNLKLSHHFLDAASNEERRKHCRFIIDEEDEEPAEGIDVSGNSEEDGVKRPVSTTQDHGSDDDEANLPLPNSRTLRSAEKQSRKEYDELSQRVDRVRRLSMALEDLELRQKLLSKGARKKVKPGDPDKGFLPVFKWRKQRSR